MKDSYEQMKGFSNESPAARTSVPYKCLTAQLKYAKNSLDVKCSKEVQAYEIVNDEIRATSLLRPHSEIPRNSAFERHP